MSVYPDISGNGMGAAVGYTPARRATKAPQPLESFYVATDSDFANAIDRAKAVGISPMLDPSKVYPVNRPIVIGDEDIVIWSPTTTRAQGGGLITTTLATGTFLHFAGANSGIERIRIKGSSRSSGLQYLVKFERSNLSAPTDLDGIVLDATLEGADTLLFVNGRGINCNNNQFNDSRTHISLDHPTTFGTPTDFSTSLEGGARKYRIQNNYFHSASNRSIIVDGINPEYVYGVQITGNHHDDTQQFFRGWLNDAVVDSNVGYRMGQTSGYTVDAFAMLGSRNTIIGDNRFSGDTAITSAFALRRLRRIFYLVGVHDGLRIVNNVGFGAMREFLSADVGTVLTNFAIDNNIMRYMCLENDTQTRSAIATAGDASRGSFVGNKLEIPAMTNNASAALLNKVAGTWTDVAYHSNQTSGGMPDFDGTPTTGGVHEYDNNNWQFFTSAGVARRSATYPSSDASGAAI